MGADRATYRGAESSDAPVIAGFQIAMALETENIRLDPRVCAAGVSAVFREPSRGRYFVAEISGEIVASLLITYEWSDWREGEIWWIQSVFVRPEFRSRGVFRGLFEHVRELATADRTVRGLRLYVDRRNQKAQDVYRRLGMDGDHYLVYEWIKGATGAAPLL